MGLGRQSLESTGHDEHPAGAFLQRYAHPLLSGIVFVGSLARGIGNGPPDRFNDSRVVSNWIQNSAGVDDNVRASLGLIMFTRPQEIEYSGQQAFRCKIDCGAELRHSRFWFS